MSLHKTQSNCLERKSKIKIRPIDLGYRVASTGCLFFFFYKNMVLLMHNLSHFLNMDLSL